MRVGLGTGRAAAAGIRALGERVAGRASAAPGCPPPAPARRSRGSWGSRSSACAIPSTWPSTARTPWIPRGLLVKGAGGALVRERLVADAAARFLVLVDPPKLRRLARRVGHPPGGGRARSGRPARPMSSPTSEPRRRPGRSDDGLAILDLQVPGGVRLERRGRAGGGRPRCRGPRPLPGRSARVLVGRPTAPGSPPQHSRGQAAGRRYDLPRAARLPRPRPRRAGTCRGAWGAAAGPASPARSCCACGREALAELGSELPRGVALISATNGKTTTARLVASCAREAGWELISNPSGRQPAVGGRDAPSSAPRSNAHAPQAALFEVDEAALSEVARQLPPRRAAADEPLPRPARPARGARAAWPTAGSGWWRSCRPRPRRC